MYVLLIILLSNGFAANGNDPIVKIESTNPTTQLGAQNQKEVVAYKGTNVSFTCSVTLLPPNHSVTWVAYGLSPSVTVLTIAYAYAHRSDVADPNKYTLDHPDNSSWRLTIRNIQESDGGMLYSCRVIMGAQKYIEDRRILRVKGVLHAINSL